MHPTPRLLALGLWLLSTSPVLALPIAPPRTHDLPEAVTVPAKPAKPAPRPAGPVVHSGSPADVVMRFQSVLGRATRPEALYPYINARWQEALETETQWHTTPDEYHATMLSLGMMARFEGKVVQQTVTGEIATVLLQSTPVRATADPDATAGEPVQRAFYMVREGGRWKLVRPYMAPQSDKPDAKPGAAAPTTPGTMPGSAPAAPPGAPTLPTPGR